MKFPLPHLLIITGLSTNHTTSIGAGLTGL